ncbi:MAG: flagellar export chaperone FliS [Trichloromonadaceae bacterium]
MNPYTNQYQSNQVATASREQILIMLYDGAIRFVRQAGFAIEDRNWVKKREGINKAIAIVSEFRATLDHQIGGEIAANLDALYEYMLRELVKANAQNDLKALRVVEDLLSGLRDTWKQAIDIARAETVGRMPAAANGDYRPLNASL